MSYKVKDGVEPRKENDSRRTSFDRHSDLTALRPKSHQPFRFPVSAEQVLKSFNTRAFKREQPDNPDLMLRIISESLVHNEPLSFVMYWGKGLRSHLAEPELKCLSFIASMIARVGQVYAPGAQVSLVFTDTHARLNGHPEQDISSYFHGLTVSVRERGFEIRRLSELVQSGKVGSEEDAAHAIPPAELFSILCASAAKWFKGEGPIEQGAIAYYRANMIEKHVMERAFPRSIFVTFSPKELRSLLPDHLPIFFMYSLRHGVCDKPWFLPPDFVSRTARTGAHHGEFVGGS